MAINKPRHHGRQSRRGRRTPRRRNNLQRTAAEQLDYEMELLRAQREGREEDFKLQEREKLRVRTAARLDAEMDDYFNSRPKKEEQELTKNGDDESKTTPDSTLFDKSDDGNGTSAKLTTNASINALVNNADDQAIPHEGVTEN